MNYTADTFRTPVGDFSFAIDATGALVATAFGGLDALQPRLSAFDSITRAPLRQSSVRKQVGEYFAGQRNEFDLPLAPHGTAFQRSVWTALGEIPFGETRSYGGLAESLGHPGAARAIGRANATNPICLIVPCHRVIGADGSLTGFAFGVEIKRRLLEHEQRPVAA